MPPVSGGATVSTSLPHLTPAVDPPPTTPVGGSTSLQHDLLEECTHDEPDAAAQPFHEPLSSCRSQVRSPAGLARQTSFMTAAAAASSSQQMLHNSQQLRQNLPLRDAQPTHCLQQISSCNKSPSSSARRSKDHHDATNTHNQLVTASEGSLVSIPEADHLPGVAAPESSPATPAAAAPPATSKEALLLQHMAGQDRLGPLSSLSPMQPSQATFTAPSAVDKRRHGSNSNTSSSTCSRSGEGLGTERLDSSSRAASFDALCREDEMQLVAAAKEGGLMTSSSEAYCRPAASCASTIINSSNSSGLATLGSISSFHSNSSLHCSRLSRSTTVNQAAAATPAVMTNAADPGHIQESQTSDRLLADMDLCLSSIQAACQAARSKHLSHSPARKLQHQQMRPPQAAVAGMCMADSTVVVRFRGLAGAAPAAAVASTACTAAAAAAAELLQPPGPSAGLLHAPQSEDGMSSSNSNQQHMLEQHVHEQHKQAVDCTCRPAQRGGFVRWLRKQLHIGSGGCRHPNQEHPQQQPVETRRSLE